MKNIARFQKKGKPRMFYHLKRIPVTQITYNIARDIKKRILSAVDALLESLHVRYALSDGNLLEYERGIPIYHDDDVDIRVDSRDFHIINDYIGGRSNLDTDRNIKFDAYNLDRTWYHVSLINTDDIPSDYDLKNCISLDFVISNEICGGFWKKYDIDFDNLRRINYLDIDTFAPGKEDTIRVLQTAFGVNYLTPNYALYDLH